MLRARKITTACIIVAMMFSILPPVCLKAEEVSQNSDNAETVENTAFEFNPNVELFVNPEASVAAASGSVIKNGDEFDSTNCAMQPDPWAGKQLEIVSHTDYRDGKALFTNLASSYVSDANGLSFTYNVDVADGGYFTLDVSALWQYDWFSSFSIQVNDGEIIPITQANVTVDSAFKNKGHSPYNYVALLHITPELYLAQGENTITFYITKNAGGRYVFTLDYFELTLTNSAPPTPTPKPILKPQTIKINGYDFDRTTSVYPVAYPAAHSHAQYGAGVEVLSVNLSGTHAASPGMEDGLIFTYEVNVPEAGEYKLDIYATSPAVQFYSSYKIKINDGEAIPMSLTNMTENSETGADNGYAHPYYIKFPLELKSGVNTITFYVAQRTFLAADDAVQRYVFLLAYLELAKVGASVGFYNATVDYSERFEEIEAVPILAIPGKGYGEIRGLQATFSTQDVSVALVDSATGIITPTGGGKADISVEIKSDNPKDNIAYIGSGTLDITVKRILVGEMEFFDNSGKITTYSGQSYVKCVVNAKKTGGTGSQAATLVCVLRDGAGNAIKKAAKTVNINSGNSADLIVEMSGLSGIPTGAYFDAFLIDTFEGAVPLSGVKSLLSN